MLINITTNLNQGTCITGFSNFTLRESPTDPFRSSGQRRSPHWRELGIGRHRPPRQQEEDRLARDLRNRTKHTTTLRQNFIWEYLCNLLVCRCVYVHIHACCICNIDIHIHSCSLFVKEQTDKHNVGALIIPIGFVVYYTTIIKRKPPKTLF